MKIHTDVKRRIEKIAEHGKQGDQFDDADIMWFLDRYKKKKGRHIDWLRAQYQWMLDYYDNETNKDRWSTLFIFHIEKRRARGLLGDINL